MSGHKLNNIAATILVLAVLAGRLAAAAERGRIVTLDDPTRLFADWPREAGVSVSLPAAKAFAWPPDRQFREVVMDTDGGGGSLFARGDFGGAAGDVGVKVTFSGGPVRRVGATPTVCYLGGDGPGRDSRHQLRLNAIRFSRTGCETGKTRTEWCCRPMSTWHSRRILADITCRICNSLLAASTPTSAR